MDNVIDINKVLILKKYKKLRETMTPEEIQEYANNSIKRLWKIEKELDRGFIKLVCIYALVLSSPILLYIATKLIFN